LTDDGLLLRYRGETLVGLTVLDASARVEDIGGRRSSLLDELRLAPDERPLSG